MKKKSFLTLIMAFAMASLCCLLTACSDDDNDDTPQQPITSGTFTYLFAFNKDILQWSDFSLTLTPSKGSPVTTSLNDPFNRKLDRDAGVREVFARPLYHGSARPSPRLRFLFRPHERDGVSHDHQRETQLEGEGWLQAQDNDFYTVTLVEAYGVSTNTNQNFANYQHAFKYSGIQGKHLAEFAQGRSNSDVTLTLTVENNKVVVKRSDKQ